LAHACPLTSPQCDDGLHPGVQPGHTRLRETTRRYAPPDQGDAKGEYDGGLRLFLMAAASLYILSPLDAIPELIFLFVVSSTTRS
jgi:hypothetical protein